MKIFVRIIELYKFQFVENIFEKIQGVSFRPVKTKEKHTNRCAFSFALKLIQNNNLAFRQTDLRLLTASQACASCGRYSKPRRGRNKENFRGALARRKGDHVSDRKKCSIFKSQFTSIGVLFLLVIVISFCSS